MNNICHIAMTAADFLVAEKLPEHPVWMSCQFASGNPGLSNLPRQLPEGAYVMLDDSTPPTDHDPAIILAQLTYLSKELQLAGIILDFQRPGSGEASKLARLLTEHLPCPVCVSSLYADGLSCPVLLPPPPLHCAIDAYLQDNPAAELWLEMTQEAECITVTEKGSKWMRLSPDAVGPLPFEDPHLCCRYGIEVLEDRAVFTLLRDEEMLKRLQVALVGKGVRHFLFPYCSCR